MSEESAGILLGGAAQRAGFEKSRQDQQVLADFIKDDFHHALNSLQRIAESSASSAKSLKEIEQHLKWTSMLICGAVGVLIVKWIF